MSKYDVLRSSEELQALIDSSRSRQVVLFKHSLTCPVSTAGLREFQLFLEARPGDDPVGYGLIEIQNQRPLSNSVAESTGVRHESPQALLFENGEVTWHASHWSITSKALAGVVDG